MKKEENKVFLNIIKVTLIISLILLTILLFSPALKALEDQNLANKILQYAIILTVWQLIIFASILTFGKDLANAFSHKKTYKKNPKTFYKRSYYSPQSIESAYSPTYNEQIKAAKGNIKLFENRESEKEKFLFFERTYHYILPSQIEYLLTLSFEDLSDLETEEIFGKIKKEKYITFKNWTKTLFLDFLKTSGLLSKTQKTNDYTATKLGKDFVKYIKLRNYIK